MVLNRLCLKCYLITLTGKCFSKAFFPLLTCAVKGVIGTLIVDILFMGCRNALHMDVSNAELSLGVKFYAISLIAK